MPRSKREDWAGARHHVMNRGARREPLFFSDDHCAVFLEFLSELPYRYGLLIHAYALMPNHYHLLLESTRGQLSRGMGFLGSRYATWLNTTHPDWDGPVYRDRFKSKPVVQDEHWHHLPVYLHLNPVRSGIVMNISKSRWTSHGVYAGLETVPEWLSVDDLMEGYGSNQGYLDYLQEVQMGRSGAPDEFQRVVFTRYVRSKRIEPNINARITPPPSSDQVLKVVAEECEVGLDELRVVRMGRTGNLTKKLAVYWLVIGAGLTNKEAASILCSHPVRVSQTIRELREKSQKDKELSRIMGKIQERLNC